MSGELRAGESDPPGFVIIALGSNLGNSRQLIVGAIERLRHFSARPLRKSSLWETVPVDCPPGSPVFLNAVVMLDPRHDETAESLLSKLQELERESGRQRTGVAHEPRPLDLDLIAFAKEVRNSPELTLPHPRAHLRRFVLQPLSEIAPELVLPGQAGTVAQLLESLPPDQTMRRVNGPEAFSDQ